MGLNFQGLYMNYVYLPVYDLTVAKLAAYQRLQKTVLDLLSVQQGQTVLFVGAGNGSEVIRLLEQYPSKDLQAIAVDLSHQALNRCRRRAARRGYLIQAFQMDAQRLAFADGQFDRLLCVHTMDFLPDPSAAARELIRVLKRGGEFVVSFPSGNGVKEVGKEIRLSVCSKVRRGRLLAAGAEALTGAGAGLAFAPLAMSSKRPHGYFTLASLKQILSALEITEFEIQEDRAYQDFIVWGKR